VPDQPAHFARLKISCVHGDTLVDPAAAQIAVQEDRFDDSRVAKEVRT